MCPVVYRGAPTTPMTTSPNSADTRPDADIYARVILASVLERQQWRTLYQAAKACQVPVDTLSATGQPP